MNSVDAGDFDVSFTMEVEDSDCFFEGGDLAFVLHAGTPGPAEHSCPKPPYHTAFQHAWAVYFHTASSGIEPFLWADLYEGAGAAPAAAAAPRPLNASADWGEHVVTLHYRQSERRLHASWTSESGRQHSSKYLHTDIHAALRCQGRGPCHATIGFLGITPAQHCYVRQSVTAVRPWLFAEGEGAQNVDQASIGDVLALEALDDAGSSSTAR